MSKELFGTSNGRPKLPKTIVLRGSASMRGMIRLRPKNIPEAQLMRAIKLAVDGASQRIATDLKKALDAAMQSPVWPTLNGRADIYETGQLMESGRVDVGPDGVSIRYDAPYAALVHYGGYIHPYGNQSERIYLPPRPWVDAVLSGLGPIEPFDFASYYREAIEKAINGD